MIFSHHILICLCGPLFMRLVFFRIVGFHMNKKNTLTTILTLTATIVAVMLLGGITVFADEVTYPVSGECGNSVTWTLDAEGTLTVSGTGKMSQYQTYPWKEYAGNIKNITIEDGVTSIEQAAFANCENLKTVTLADSVTTIEYAAFAGDSRLYSINLPDNITTIGKYAF